MIELSPRCLAIDAGTELAGYADVIVRNGRLLVVEAGHRHLLSDTVADLQWLAAHVRDVHGTGGFLAAEQVLTSYAHHVKFKSPDEHLFLTKDMEGGVVWLARFLGATVVRIPAVQWRADLGIHPPLPDAQVKLVVEHLYGASVADLFHNAEARGHAYDALGLAAVALARQKQYRLVLPGMVLADLDKIRKGAAADRKAIKAAKKLVDPITRFLAAIPITPTLLAISNACGRLIVDDTVTLALRIVARSKSPIAPRATAALVAGGLMKAPKAKGKKKAA
jgi:hypothetical protein